MQAAWLVGGNQTDADYLLEQYPALADKPTVLIVQEPLNLQYAHSLEDEKAAPSTGFIAILAALHCSSPSSRLHLYGMNWSNGMWSGHKVGLYCCIRSAESYSRPVALQLCLVRPFSDSQNIHCCAAHIIRHRHSSSSMMREYATAWQGALGIHSGTSASACACFHQTIYTPCRVRPRRGLCKPWRGGSGCACMRPPAPACASAARPRSTTPATGTTGATTCACCECYIYKRPCRPLLPARSTLPCGSVYQVHLCSEHLLQGSAGETQHAV